MKTYPVKQLMVPLSEYATVLEDATLVQAFEALENAQQSFDEKRYRHRAVLVLDKNSNVVGKLSQHDLIEALEPNYRNLRKPRKSRGHGKLHSLGFSEDYIKATLEKDQFWETPLENLCDKAVHQVAKVHMYTPNEGEFVKENETMDKAIHRLIVGHHHSLLVTSEHDDREIVGVLRLTDVFDFVSRALREC